MQASRDAFFPWPWQHIRSSCSAESCPFILPTPFKNCCPQQKLSHSAKRTLLSCLIYRYINWLPEWSDLPRGSQWQSLGGIIKLLNIILCPCQWTIHLLPLYFTFHMTEYFPCFHAWAEAVRVNSFGFDLVPSNEQSLLSGLQGDNAIFNHVYSYYYNKILSIGLIISCNRVMNKILIPQYVTECLTSHLTHVKFRIIFLSLPLDPVQGGTSPASSGELISCWFVTFIISPALFPGITSGYDHFKCFRF